MNQLKESLEKWLLPIVLKEKPSKEIKAFRFGLYEAVLSEDPEVTGAVLYLAGHSEFETEANEWACEQPAFVADEQLCVLRLTDGQWLFLPNGTELAEDAQEEVAGEVWMDFVNMLQQLLREVLLQQEVIAGSFLGTAIPIFVGFEDGDLEKVK